VFVIRVLAGVCPFVVVFGAGVVLVGQSYSSDSGAGGASGMCAGGVRAVLVVLAGQSYSLAVAHVVVCVLVVLAGWLYSLAVVHVVACAGSIRAVLVGRSYLSVVAVVLACVLAAFVPMLVVLALAWTLVFREPFTRGRRAGVPC
jgi:hypothetical protein